MDINKSKEYLKKLDSLYAKKENNILDNEIARKEYLKLLETIPDDIMPKIFDTICKKSKYLPTISEIYQTYQDYKISQIKDDDNNNSNINCFICEDNGFITYTIDNYEYIASCNCKKGFKYKYNGKVINDRKTNFYINEIENVLSQEQIISLKLKNSLKIRGTQGGKFDKQKEYFGNV